ncbi:MAG: NAD(P)H-dependent oxidoreductase [Bacteroidia bacterium]|nr:NAD(P)H-dependent oxidoreductase [Bacteroidia bacterium]MDW8159616.1 NAD(P)H-dependent oxidoreductase [Bacteroidia bacterium]
MNLIKTLLWRYAAKRMNGNAIPEEKLERILEAIRLSASSFGLQPYTILVIQNLDLRKKIQPVAWDQPQITSCSHLLVFAAWKEVTEAKISEYISNIARTRNLDIAELQDFKNMMIESMQKMPKEMHFHWAARQAYIALGTGLIAAASEEVDATPMEGFIPAEVDKLLNLESKGLASVAMLALGYRDEMTDPLAKAAKVRRPKEELFVWY